MSSRRPSGRGRGGATMTSPLWARALLRFLARPDDADNLVGDLEESHRTRRSRRGPAVSWLLTGAEALDLAASVAWGRIRGLAPGPRSPAEAARTDVLSGLGVSWLDFRLGFRMLVRFPGLTAVAGLAIAFAIAIGAGTFEFARSAIFPTMPFEDGDRVVLLVNRGNEGFDRRGLHDFELWREELASVETLGAWRVFRRTVRTARGGAEAVLGAELTASAMEIARTPPLLGRPLSAADEQPGAPAVAVLGHGVWRAHFGADPDVVGTTFRLGSEETTVVGVMPEGFGWPRAYRIWTPLRLRAIDYPWGEGPSIQMVGRLAPGVSRRAAQAELTAMGERTAAEHPETHARQRPLVQRFGSIATDESDTVRALLLSVNVLAFLGLTLLVCGNVALLLFARTAARQNEIVVRGALGAGRGRIVTQLVVEALVLAGVASAVGLVAADAGLGWVVGVVHETTGGEVGYWVQRDLTGGTILYAVVFTLLTAVVCGAVPALKLTGGGVHARLQRIGTSGGGVEFGRLWTTVIVSQVAATVAFVPIIVWAGTTAAEVRNTDFGFPADEYLMAELLDGSRATARGEELDHDGRGRALTPEYAAAWKEVRRRLKTEPALDAVAFASALPGGHHTPSWVSVEGPSAPQTSRYGHSVRVAAVDPDFFQVAEASIRGGRAFGPADHRPGEHVAIVNEDFVRLVLEDRSALGRRVQFADRTLEPGEPNPGPWYEIVGVVEQRPMYVDGEGRAQPGIYLPLGAVERYPVRIALRVGEDPTAFAPRLREIVAEVEPGLVLRGVRPLDETTWEVETAYTGWFWVLLVAGGIGLLLATAGIYSIMSFTVSRRTHEIGVRVALGADRSRIVWAILRRAARQVTLGVAIGGTLIVLFLMNPELNYQAGTRDAALLACYLVAMACVCALACVVPARRALAVEPTEALRADG